MDAPLWTETHAPELSDIRQPKAREHLQGAIEEPMNLLVHGPKGSGKTAAVRAFARAVHENPDADFTELNMADVFVVGGVVFKRVDRVEVFDVGIRVVVGVDVGLCGPAGLLRRSRGGRLDRPGRHAGQYAQRGERLLPDRAVVGRVLPY